MPGPISFQSSEVSSNKGWAWTVDALEKKMVEYILNHTASDRAHEAFHRFDRGGCGQITLNALKAEFKAAGLGLNDEQARELFKRYDVDQDGRISNEDFCKYLSHPRNWEAQNVQQYEPSAYWEGLSPRATENGSKDIDRLVHLIQEKIRGRISPDAYEAFKAIDADGKGWVSQDDLQALVEDLGIVVSAVDMADVWTYFDADGDGVVNEQDFSDRVLPKEYSLADSHSVRAAQMYAQRRSWTASGGAIMARETTSAWDSKPSREMPSELRGGKDAKSYHIPGYTGFIRGQQHIAGRTYGNTCRRALNKDYDINLKRAAVPAAPHSRTVVSQSPANTVVSRDERQPRRIPGYQGFCAGSRDKYGQTFGATTKEVLNQPAYANTMVKKRGTNRLSHFG